MEYGRQKSVKRLSSPPPIEKCTKPINVVFMRVFGGSKPLPYVNHSTIFYRILLLINLERLLATRGGHRKI